MTIKNDFLMLCKEDSGMLPICRSYGVWCRWTYLMMKRSFFWTKQTGSCIYLKLNLFLIEKLLYHRIPRLFQRLIHRKYF